MEDLQTQSEARRVSASIAVPARLLVLECIAFRVFLSL